jgi:L-2-hydroxyglutarate oxidase LhgO
MEQIDVAVIGAGVTGLAAAQAIASLGLSTCVLERHVRAGLDTSTHNSGVIHAGLYYPAGTLKARLCVQGNRQLYEFAGRHGVAHVRTGKLVVASESSEVGALEALAAQAAANGVEDVEIVDARFIAAREPAVLGQYALFSPSSGTIDAEHLVRTLRSVAEASGAIVLTGSALVAAESTADGIALRTARETILARQVVNAAGLYADDVSQVLGGEIFTIYPCRGEYAELAPSLRHVVNGLVYPLPHGHGLGVHIVPTPAGAVWLGPTVRYQGRKDDYEADRLPLEAFLDPVRRLLPQVNLTDLRLSGSGIRAKLHPPSETFADFMIRRDSRNPAIVHAAGIDSPGLTSCLAIGQFVGELVSEGFR